MFKTLIGLLQLALAIWMAILLLPSPLAIAYLIIAGILILVATFTAGKESK